MNINKVLKEADSMSNVYDANNLPQQLNRGDRFATKHSAFGEKGTGEIFKVYDKLYDQENDTFRYSAFSINRIVPSHDPEEANEKQDFVFYIKNGKIVPHKNYAHVAREHNLI